MKRSAGKMIAAPAALFLTLLLPASCATNDSMETFQDYLQSSDMSFESQNAELIAKVNKLQTQIETLEEEQKTYVKQDTLAREAELMDERIETVSSRTGDLQKDLQALQPYKDEIQTLSAGLQSVDSQVEALETDLRKSKAVYAEKMHLDALEERFAALQKQFSGFYASMAQLVEYAGYDADAGVDAIGRDIVDISKDINALHDKMERLREAMALFVNNP